MKTVWCLLTCCLFVGSAQNVSQYTVAENVRIALDHEGFPDTKVVLGNFTKKYVVVEQGKDKPLKACQDNPREWSKITFGTNDQNKIHEQLFRSFAKRDQPKDVFTDDDRLNYYTKRAVGSEAFAKAAAFALWGDFEHHFLWPDESHRESFRGRFEGDFAVNFSRNTVEYAVSSWLHTDPRFRSSGKDSFRGRVWYAFKAPLFERRNGQDVLAFSRFAGFGVTAAITSYEHPWKTQAAYPLGQVGFGALAILGQSFRKEFLPEIKHILHRH